MHDRCRHSVRARTRSPQSLRSVPKLSLAGIFAVAQFGALKKWLALGPYSIISRKANAKKFAVKIDPEKADPDLKTAIS
jgi:hypothetical protein